VTLLSAFMIIQRDTGNWKASC